MKITLIYHLYRNTKNLKESLESILNQESKDFEIIFIDDGIEKEAKNIFDSFNWNKLKNIKLISISQNLGHSFAFNESLNHSAGEYVYYCGSNIVLKNNFVSVLEDQIKSTPDVVSFYQNGANGTIPSVSELLKCKFNQSLKNKLFSVKFLKENNIELINFKYFPLLFLFKVLSAFKSWQIVGDGLCEFNDKEKYSYNLYNLFEQADIIINDYSKTKMWNENKEKFEYFLIVSILCTFLIRIFKMYDEPKTKKLAISAAERWLKINLPNWKENKVIIENKNFDDKKLNEYLVKFNFDQKYIESFIKNE